MVRVVRIVGLIKSILFDLKRFMCNIDKNNLKPLNVPLKCSGASYFQFLCFQSLCHEPDGTSRSCSVKPADTQHKHLHHIFPTRYCLTSYIQLLFVLV